jgi:hypothetical protein
MASLRDVVFFLAEDGVTLLILDVTSSMEVARAASTTMKTLQSGVKVSDHYHPDLPMINITGTINSTKIRNVAQTPANYVKLINQSMDNSVVFTLYGTEDGLIPSFDNCVITNFTYLKEGKDSLEVNLSVQQLDFGMKATLDSLTTVTVSPSSDTGSSLAGKTDPKTGSKTMIDGIPLTQKYIEVNKLPPAPTPTGGAT